MTEINYPIHLEKQLVRKSSEKIERHLQFIYVLTRIRYEKNKGTYKLGIKNNMEIILKNLSKNKNIKKNR